MDIKIRESNSLGALLYVTNLASNAQVNSSKLWIDPFSSPSNHLMAGKVGREDLAHQRLILGVNGHALVIAIDMVNRVRLAIIVDKDGLNKSSGKLVLSFSSENGE